MNNGCAEDICRRSPLPLRRKGRREFSAPEKKAAEGVRPCRLPAFKSAPALLRPPPSRLRSVPASYRQAIPAPRFLSPLPVGGKISALSPRFRPSLLKKHGRCRENGPGEARLSPGSSPSSVEIIRTRFPLPVPENDLKKNVAKKADGPAPVPLTFLPHQSAGRPPALRASPQSDGRRLPACGLPPHRTGRRSPLPASCPRSPSEGKFPALSPRFRPYSLKGFRPYSLKEGCRRQDNGPEPALFPRRTAELPHSPSLFPPRTRKKGRRLLKRP